VIAATVFEVLLDALQFLRAAFHSHRQLAAENLFLRKQLALGGASGLRLALDVPIAGDRMRRSAPVCRITLRALL
jgi:hypothetical protein